MRSATATAAATAADVATIVLAAGGSRRLGRPKQLVDAGGEPLVCRVARACLALGGGPLAVMLGAHADEVAAALRALPVATVRNLAWQDGLASSLRAAVQWAEGTAARALLVTLADQPLLTAAHLGALRDAWLAGAPIAASRYAGALAVPAIFDRACWPELTALTGDQGAGRLLRSGAVPVVAIDWPDGAVDIDTPADVDALARRRDG